MTSFSSMFKVDLKNKFRNMNFVLMIDVIAIVVAIIWNAIQGNLSKQSYLAIAFSFSIIVYFVSFVILAYIQEKSYTRDSYRLIPINDTKFYLANLASTLVAYLYVIVAQLVLYAIAFAINAEEFNDYLQMISMMNGRASFDAPSAMLGSLAFVASVLGAIIFNWATITLIHLVTRSASNFLPSTGRRFLNIVLYIIVIWLVIEVTSSLTNNLSSSVSSLFSVTYASGFLLKLLIYLVIAAVESAISIFLMSRWVETITE
ncbi:hypothetical protein M5C72_02010 [Companilactobacillus allii]|uniref:Uncharacterized protein n=1 Tax=Companilactobacillus allii TaxID=1847728 RepID=A0A1P8Q2C6_9LACO|nr:hypothetical protein [Companilactobacillus allii]APX71939.1 hypothetical protein BTM29_04930 [Companilactobacillus allii]USQ69033.1 hypothetical protein M5C72_02010 [Companilactobacillus allii]